MAKGLGPKLVIFDCDGTLVDSQHMIIEATTMAFAAYGLRPLPRDHVLGGVGLSLVEAMRRLLPEAEDGQVVAMADSYREAFFELRSQANTHEPLYDGAREVIAALTTHDDILLGIATGKARRGINAILEREGFACSFATIQTADNAPSKPHPGMIEQALNEVGAERGAAVMIGDTTYDIEMAHNAGVASIGVVWGYHPFEDLSEACPSAIVDDFDGLLHEVHRIIGPHEAFE